MKFRRSKISKKTFWIIGAFVFVVLGYFLYRSFAVREGQKMPNPVLEQQNDIPSEIGLDINKNAITHIENDHLKPY
jgi:hypothetical protein